MKAFKLWTLAVIALAISFLTACSTSDNSEPQSEGKTMKIGINLDCEDLATRAATNHSGHKLRFIAILYEGSYNNTSMLYFTRKELIDGETGDNNLQNFLEFDADPNKKYTIHLFADYIPEDATLKDGQMGMVSFKTYGDYYYQTTVKDNLTMLSTPQSPNSYTPDSRFFNNDNYDCFAFMETFEKKTNNYLIDAKLKRIVSKIRFVDNSANSGSYRVGVKRLGYYRQIDFVNSIAVRPYSFDSDKDFEEVTVSNNKAINSSDKELLFFYSFATKSGTSLEETVYLSFTTTPSSGGSKTFVTKDLSIKRNHITTVTGQFLDEDLGNSNNPGDEDPEDPSLQEGNKVFVNLGIEQEEWGTLSSSWTN